MGQGGINNNKKIFFNWTRRSECSSYSGLVSYSFTFIIEGCCFSAVCIGTKGHVLIYIYLYTFRTIIAGIVASSYIAKDFNCTIIVILLLLFSATLASGSPTLQNKSCWYFIKLEDSLLADFGCHSGWYLQQGLHSRVRHHATITTTNSHHEFIMHDLVTENMFVFATVDTKTELVENKITDWRMRGEMREKVVRISEAML